MKAIYINCSLKSGDNPSHTEGLMKKSTKILKSENIEVEIVRLADLAIHATIVPVFKEDDWPELYEKILESHILVIGTPIWLGVKSSLATKLIERLYAHSAEKNDQGQAIYYNKVGGVVATGNEDGAKNVCTEITYALMHLGFTIPPQVDAYWVGEAGPGPSYLDAGTENEFTQRNTRIMTWNLIHFARLLDQHPIPATGNKA